MSEVEKEMAAISAMALLDSAARDRVNEYVDAMKGDAGSRSRRRRSQPITGLVIAAIRDNGAPMTATEIAVAIGYPYSTVNSTVGNLKLRGLLVKAERGYTVPETQ